MDFAALPPEVNSSRMYTGPGAGPLLAAASAWEATAVTLGSTAADFKMVVDGLGGVWLGPSAMAMSATAHLMQSWMLTTAERASETVSKILAAVVAYEVAFAATVPPPVVAANRALLAFLVSTNFLGVNTAAIMATEAQYAEMWAQDVAAMFEYQLASAQATVLPPFSPLVASTKPVQVLPKLVGLAESIFAPGSNQATTGLAGVMNLISGSNGSAFGSFLNATIFNGLISSGLYYNLPQAIIQGITQPIALSSLGQTQEQIEIAEANQPPPSSQSDAAASQPGEGVVASSGDAAQVGGLSTPDSWGQTANKGVNAQAPVAAALEETPEGVGGLFVPPLAVGGAGGSSQRRDRAYGVPVMVVKDGKWN